MDYAICLKWGGLHGHVALLRSNGEVLYVLQSSGLRSACFTVVDAQGREVFRVRRRGVLASTYTIARAGKTVAVAGSNWLRSRGIINVADRPAIRCRYGWGIKSVLVLRNGTNSIGRISLMPRVGVKGMLTLEAPTFNEDSFIVACALLFRDWASRGR